MYTVRVTRDDCRKGEAGDCFRCAVAIALQRATGDDNANVYESGHTSLIEVHGRHIDMPLRVRDFVWAYDDLPRRADGRVQFPKTPPPALSPFAFTLPDLDDPEWTEECYHCQDLFPPADLDDEQLCAECREDAAD